MADIALVPLGAHSRIEPLSALGLLWLQTHFEDHQWDLICSGRARLSASSSEQLRWDAEDCGLRVVEQPSPV